MDEHIFVAIRDCALTLMQGMMLEKIVVIFEIFASAIPQLLLRVDG
jgi:hypothetical protein